MTIYRPPRSAPRSGIVRGGDALRFKITSGHGRLYVEGPDAAQVVTWSNIPGRAWNERRRAFEISRTLETLVAIKHGVGIAGGALAARCSEDVMAWARAARRSQDVILDVHRRMADGYRLELPWHDARAGLPAPPGADDSEVEVVDGRRLWKYRPPYAHQEIMATVAGEVSGCAFLAEMGTGKTRSAIEAMAYIARRGFVDMFLIVSPSRVTSVWDREVRMWSTNLEPIRLSGSVRSRKQWLDETFQALRHGSWMVPTTPVAVTNYEVLYKLVDTLMEAGIRLGVVFDEGHRIRNPQAKVSKAGIRLAGATPWRLLMTGTPILNGLQNIWSQWYFVDLGVTFGGNYVQFRREFFTDNEYTMKLEHNEGTVEEFNARLHIRGLRFRKEDCLDLPPKVYEVESVEMSSEQAAAYREMEDQLLVYLNSVDENVEGTTTASIVLTKILRLTQITSGFLMPDPDDEFETRKDPIRFKRNPKLEATNEIVREQVADGKSVIVWACYREDFKVLSEKLADLNPVKIVGGMKHKDAEEAERAFNAGESKVLIGNPASAGVGLNLQAASVAIYYSQTYNLEYRAQSEDRCHRSGSEVHDSVTYIDMVCEGTLDEVVREVLASKMELAEAVVELRRSLLGG